MHHRTIAPLLLLLFFIFFLATTSCNPVRETKDEVHPRHEYHKERLDKVGSDAPFFEKEKQEKIHEIRREIGRLATQLLREEIELKQRVEQKTALTRDWLWFFNPTKRYEVDKAQLQINDQERIVANTLEDIEMEWKRLKPLYGVFSKMFLMEALGFLPNIVSVTWGIFTGIVELGLLSFLVFGPLTGVFVAVGMSVGLDIVPFVFAFSTLVVSIYWILHFPWVMIQYDPTWLEFLGLYAALLALLLPLVYYTFRLCFPESFRRSTAKTMRIKVD